MSKDKVVSTVKETTDYNKFKFLKENRLITEKALAKVKKSVERDGWRNYPITVNEKMEIIEGQHTFLYAKENNLPVRYYIQNGANQKDCQILNSTKTKWTVQDYIHSYAQEGNTDYQLLENIVNTYRSIPVSAILRIVNKSLNGDHDLRTGGLNFNGVNYDEMLQKLNYMEKFIPYLNILGGRKTVMFSALSFLYNLPSIDKVRLLEVVRKNCYSMTPPTSIVIALEQLERVYNKNLGVDNRVYILMEYKKHISKGGQKW